MPEWIERSRGRLIYPQTRRHQLPICRAILGGNGCASLPQSVSRTLGQTSFVTKITEPVAESIRGEWFPMFGHEERQIPPQRVWDVYKAAFKMRPLGTVEAADADEAIREGPEGIQGHRQQADRGARR
jgi:hypothetical protein